MTGLVRGSTALWLTTACLLGGAARAQDVTVAAAADLQSVLPLLAERFAQQTGHRVNVTFGSSGNFFAQIQNGAPFDVFMSADADYPQRLQIAGLVGPGDLYEYAVGRIVLWVRTDSGLDASRGLQLLADPKVRRVAIANPAHAPYGRAAVSALQHERLYDIVREKLVLGENISQAAQFLESGNADAGIIALSLTRAPTLRNAGIQFTIPSGWYPAIEQAAVVLNASRHRELGRLFLEFLKGSEAMRLLQDYGFSLPRSAGVGK
jgi:molybdate transport system substrate-binding protein